MRRSPRVLLAWAAAVVVTLVTVRVVATDLGALHRRARALGADVAVVLATRDLALGTTVGPADLRTVRRPASTVASDALRDPRAAVGRVVAVALLRDDVVRARHLASNSGPGLGGVVPAGRRAVHVVLKDGFQPPVGAVVDVLATFDPTDPHATGDRQATVVARGARVLALDGTGSGSGTATAPASDGPSSAVTLLVTETEASAVAYAAATGDVAVVLAPFESACCGAPAS